MMCVKLRCEGRTYDVTMPPGSRIEQQPGGRPAVIIPGESPEDTSMVLSTRAALRAAHEGRHGLVLGRSAPAQFRP